MSGEFLPVTMEECRERGIEQPDFVYVCGDAYVDHSSFGAAIICRLLESRGYSVGMIAQPDWKDPESIQVFGEPRLGFLVSAGNMDSMVNHYTVSKKHRQKDAYSPGGEMGHRPDRAVIVYGNLIRRTYKKTPIILGGIEASLRRMGHYDYWSDQVKRSVLLDSGADMISYGMGEHSIVEIADALASGLDVKDITFIRGTVYRCKSVEHIPEPLYLPSFEEIKEKKEQYARSFGIQHQNTDPYQAKVLIEDYGNQGYVVQNPPAYPLTEQEMDDLYRLPFMRTYHPMYEKKGGIPAIEEIRFSLTSNRGCFGGCNFCALTFHQGRIVQVRSHESLLEEAVEMTKDPDFKGYIHDVGGPTADFRQPACKKQLTKGACTNRQCLFPTPCKNLIADHSDYLALLRKLRKIPKVKKVFIRSGIRFDYVLEDTKSHFLQELADYHVSGQLRVAPEHVADKRQISGLLMSTDRFIQSSVTSFFPLLQFNIVNQAFHDCLKTFFFCRLFRSSFLLFFFFFKGLLCQKLPWSYNLYLNLFFLKFRLCFLLFCNTLSRYPMFFHLRNFILLMKFLFYCL